MAVIVSGIQIGLDEPEEKAFEKARAKLGSAQKYIAEEYIVKQSVDARHKGKISLVYSVGFVLGDEKAYAMVKPGAGISFSQNEEVVLMPGDTPLETRPLVVGFGPAGMFCALLLARHGYRPVVIERGAKLEKRLQAVERFWQTGALDENSNVQFGEGGAGTFSDGKLTTRINDPLCEYVSKTFLHFGAPKETMRLAKPHIGTDLLGGIVKNIRHEILALGGEIFFETALQDIVVQNGRMSGVQANGAFFPAEVVVLATGHSARDLFTLLYDKAVPMKQKPFSVGVRAEHLQTLVDRGLYGDFAGHPRLHGAEYQFSYKENGRAVYTFCMCPGGVVVPASSEAGGVVTNGMSRYARDGQNANSALVVSVDGADFGHDPLSGVHFQRRLEQAAFLAGGSGYKAPGQNATSFLAGAAPQPAKGLTPSYALGVCLSPLSDIFPENINAMLKKGLRAFDKKIPGFAGEGAFLTGVESRTSSPVRLVRAENLQSPDIKGLYPCGEGAGYAGGIMSAAVDGLKIARQIIEEYAPCKAR